MALIDGDEGCTITAIAMTTVQLLADGANVTVMASTLGVSPTPTYEPLTVLEGVGRWR